MVRVNKSDDARFRGALAPPKRQAVFRADREVTSLSQAVPSQPKANDIMRRTRAVDNRRRGALLISRLRPTLRLRMCNATQLKPC